MTIGIDASRAFLKRRTGIEEYAYQVIRHLREELSHETVILYVRMGQVIDFDLPDSWRVRELWAPRLWTQCRLSWELLWHMPDVLFVPAHTVPVIHPDRTVVVVHGLEYEFCPEAYSWWDRWYMRTSIRASVRWASRVVCVSENTRRDVITLYGVPSAKIFVIGEGYNDTFKLLNKENSQESRQHSVCEPLPLQRDGLEAIEANNPEASQQSFPVRTASLALPKEVAQNQMPPAFIQQGFDIFSQPYFLFIGRIEERKNIGRVIEAFDLFKQETGLPHRLVLAGKPGYGYEKIKEREMQSDYKNDIIELGYVSEEEKWKLLKDAEAFVFATLYEGFGIPVLEAQSVGTAVIASNTSSLPEVAGEGALLVNPESVVEIAQAMRRLVSEPALKSAILAAGNENLKRYSWNQCARELAGVLRGLPRVPTSRDLRGK